jgi:citrate lyase beta subunit
MKFTAQLRKGEAATLRRSMLYVPGSFPAAKLRRALASDADCICFDIEDSVTFKAKTKARLAVRERASLAT